MSMSEHEVRSDRNTRICADVRSLGTHRIGFLEVEDEV